MSRFYQASFDRSWKRVSIDENRDSRNNGNIIYKLHNFWISSVRENIGKLSNQKHDSNSGPVSPHKNPPFFSDEKTKLNRKNGKRRKKSYSLSKGPGTQVKLL